MQIAPIADRKSWESVSGDRLSRYWTTDRTASGCERNGDMNRPIATAPKVHASPPNDNSADALKPTSRRVRM